MAWGRECDVFIVLNIQTYYTVLITLTQKKKQKKNMRIRNLFQVIRVVWLRAAAQQSIRYLGGERFRTESWRRHFPRNKINWVRCSICTSFRIHNTLSQIVGTGLIVMATSEEDLQVIKETDAMYYGGKSPEAIQILRRHSQTNNPEVLWRLVRACYTVGKFFIKDQAESKRLSDEAMEYAKRGIAIDEHSFSTQKVSGSPPTPSLPASFVNWYSFSVDGNCIELV